MFVASVFVATLPSQSMCQGVPITVSVGAGTEVERYLRILGLAGLAPTGQWTIRPLASRELATTPLAAVHPWRGEFPESTFATRTGLSLIAPTIGVIENSSFPYGFNDGPVWAGKGLTTVASAGATAARGAFSIVLDPIAFVAQNAAFRIADNGLFGGREFADWIRPDAIDQPQRFGSRSYARFDPGESEARVEGFGLAGGLSSRAQVWGPAYEHPMILGNNAGGIPRLFAGTRAPVDARWVTIHGQVIWGELNESAYGADTGISRRHFATAVVGTMGVKAVPGLELGGSRFFHAAWPVNGLRHAPWLQVVQALIAHNQGEAVGGSDNTNQLASAFIRLAPPGKRFEVYGEYGREDRNADLRDFALEPDHDGGYMVGFARVWVAPDTTHITVLRGEVLNTRISHLQEQRPQQHWYMHLPLVHGHTEHGQVLGSAGGFGGGASNVAVDRYTTSGRTTIRWDRIVRAIPLNGQGLPVSNRADVTHAIGVERALFTRHGEATVGAAVVKDFNRYFAADALNANVSVGYRFIR